MIGFDEAAAHIAAFASPLGKEIVPLAQTPGRMLAEPAIAALDSPAVAVSTMDGYAVREADLARLPARLPIVRENFAGTAEPGQIGQGECARIFTGAPIPAGADRVIIQEVAVREGDWALFERPLAAERYVRERAADFAAGTVLVEAGVELGPRQLVAAAAGDLPSLTCWKRPRVFVLATGDELAEPGTARSRSGSVPDSLSVGLGAMIERWGGEFAGARRLGDSVQHWQQVVREALSGADLLVVTGGASVGERDLAKAMFEPHGLELVFSKVSIKPGKPVWFGRAGSALVLGLPGNPSSAMVTARLLLAPLVAGLAGRAPSSTWRWREQVLAAPLGPSGDREEFVRASFGHDVGIIPLGNQDSGAKHALAAADVLIRRPANAAGLSPRTAVPALDF